MPDCIDSPVFGRSEVPDGLHEEKLQALIDRFPVRVFQILNKKLNERDLRISIDTNKRILP